MNQSPRNILHCIGNTSMLPLRRIVPGNGSRILLKLESENPTGSMKDRMALAMIEAAEADGRLTAGGAVVEYTGGSTGVSLSLVCAVKGYPLHIVTSDAFSREKLDHMRILGARLQIVPSDGGRMTEKLTRDMIEAARVVAADTGALLDRSDEQHGSDGGLSRDGRRNLGCRPEDRSTGSSRASAPPRRFAVSGKAYADTMNGSASSPSSLRNRRCCRVARPALTR